MMALVSKQTEQVILVAGGAAALFIAWNVYRGASKITGPIGDFFDALSFDKSSLGPGAELTPDALNSIDDYIARGFGEYDSAGVFRITPKGQAFIDSQTPIEENTRIP